MYRLAPIIAEDLDELLSHVWTAHLESRFKHDLPIMEYYEDLFTPGPYRFAWAVKRDNGKITGAMIADLVEMDSYDKILGMSRAMFVVPEFRGGRTALMLIGKFAEWCQEKAAYPFFMNLNSEKSQNVYRILEKYGMVKIGDVFGGVE